MANTDGPRGFFPVGSLGGSNVSAHKYEVDADTATNMFIGDLVELETDGNVGIMAAASDDYIGVVMAVYNTDMKPLKYLPASTAGYALVADDPHLICEVQLNDDSTALTAAAIGDTTDAIWTHAGSTTTGRAGVELDDATLAGDGSAAQFRILGLVDKADNAWGAHARVLVTANEHAYVDPGVAI